MRILVVVNEKNLAFALGQILSECNYTVDVVNDGIDGYKYALSNNYDCIVLDDELPRKNSYSICADLCDTKINTPIIVLDTLKGNGSWEGNVSFLSKPFAPNELVSLICSTTKQVEIYRGESLIFGDISFYPSALTLMNTRSRDTINLTQKECDILKPLLLSPNTSIIGKELLPKCDDNKRGAILNSYIEFLRKKLCYIKSEMIITSMGEEGYELGYGNN